MQHTVCSLRVIKKQLWCCCYNAGIVILDHSDLKPIATIPGGSMESVHDVAHAGNEDIVLVSSKGLFYASITGKI